MACCVCLEVNKKDRNSLQRCLKSADGELAIGSFASAWEVLSFVVNHEVDIAFISSEVEEVPYEDLIKALIKMNGELRVVLVSGDKADAYESLQLNLAGFLLKPVTMDAVKNILAKNQKTFAKGPGAVQQRARTIRMCTMPKFDMYVDGEPVRFRRKKNKELMAFLVDAAGAVVNTEMIVEALWEGEDIGRSQKSRCYVLMNILKDFLKDIGLESLVVAHNGEYRLDTSQYTSDLEDLLNGDRKLIFRYDHRYMEDYSWAERRKASIDKYVSKYHL